MWRRTRWWAVGDWRNDAACRDMELSVFFPESVPANSGYQVGWDPRPAVKVCRGCPVRPDCLEFALNDTNQYGVWGGLTEDERKELRRRRSRRIR
jgi:WhiB family transcriptional regulator, redox-sensing transcriptional regulator